MKMMPKPCTHVNCHYECALFNERALKLLQIFVFGFHFIFFCILPMQSKFQQNRSELKVLDHGSRSADNHTHNIHLFYTRLDYFSHCYKSVYIKRHTSLSMAMCDVHLVLLLLSHEGNIPLHSIRFYHICSRTYTHRK